MIPSDHFVRFYNEVFKFLDLKNGLQEFYREISRHQELHCLENFRSRGLRGVYEYYLRIRKEENCDMDICLEDHSLRLFMRKCPSLGKAINNDAGPCPKYCLHCPGWVLPMYTKAGLYIVYNLMELDQPQCEEWIFDDLTMARQKYDELTRKCPPEQLVVNFKTDN